MKQHVIHGWAAWQRVRIPVGCVEKPNQPAPVAANPDLRGMALSPEWNAMQILNMTHGNTTHLPPFPPSLHQITVNNNRLQELPAIPADLRYLDAHHNQIAVLPPLPPRLVGLGVAHNNLSAIPTPIPATLFRLSISHNNIESLPSLAHTAIERLGVGFNQLTALPALPNTVRELGCANNQITKITNLPDILEVLNCSNNPLTDLKIDNCTRLRILIANNCGLRHIPLLPPPPGGDDDDNNNNNNNGGNDGGERFRTYYFDGNPLTPEFAAIYQRYQDADPAGGAARRFRQEVLEEHRRILRERASTLSALQQTFKAPVREETGPNWYYGPQQTAAQRALQGNSGPTNLIAEFITGVPGTLERQRLGVLGQREAVGNVAAGTTAAARERVVEAALGEDNTLAQRARLYLNPGNLPRAAEAGNNEGPFVQVVDNNNNNEGEALGIAMQQALADNLGLGVDEEEVLENNNVLGGGRRRHRTPRNRKSKRQTRKQ
jgi:hypothetical protein